MLKQNQTLRSFQNFVGSIFAAIPVSPNVWTILSFFLSLVAAFEISQSNLILGLLLFISAAFLDMVDGAVARIKKETSAFGGFLDGVTDRFVEAVFLFSFMFYPLPFVLIDTKIIISALIFLGTCMPSFIRAYSEHMNVLDHKSALALGGVFERSERLIVLAIGLGSGILLSNMIYFVYSMILASLLSCITIIQRLYQINKLSKKNM